MHAPNASENDPLYTKGVNNFKLVGVYVDKTACFKRHVSYICFKSHFTYINLK